ncbi:thioredoxin domain-containing protein 16-like [Huso huso]|uniref:Thioredoxin domain-containing protein 16-like n=1 Tax=Huso huso TaxID=61971 RepID=A0ABR0Z9Z7_HUSHU
MTRQAMPSFLLLLCVTGLRGTTETGSELTELTSKGFFKVLDSGKASFIYFGNAVNPSITLFLEQLEKSVEVLEDYGILVAKVDCAKEKVPTYCTIEKVLKKVYLFRGGVMLRSFVTDTVFDENAIVAHVLFALLFNEVKYVQTPAELQNIEKAVKGRADVVLAHVQALGTAEHRAVMEAAFVYGAEYQFVLTMGGTVLQHMGVEEPGKLSAGLWFLHCKLVSRRWEPCHHSALKKPLSTVQIYTFLKLMDAPLLTEVSADPADVKTVHNHLQSPVLFLFTQRETLALDRSTAESVAWRLRGEAGVVLVHRDHPGVNVPAGHNVAYRLPAEGSRVKYLTLQDIEGVMRLFTEGDRVGLELEEEEEEEEEEHWSVLDILDDEVSESVYRDRSVNLESHLVPALTSQTFSTAVAAAGHTVVLFYNSWDAVSMAFMQSYLEVASMLKDVADVSLALVNCDDWTEVCTNQNASQIPTVMLFNPGERPRRYNGMLGTESLHSFIRLSRMPAPLRLSSEDEAESFLRGDLSRSLSPHTPALVLGLFNSRLEPGCMAFQEACLSLRGELVTGIFAEPQASQWSQQYTASLPALILSRTADSHIHTLPLLNSSTEEVISIVKRAALHPLPELTVLNLPSYLELGRPLLILFVDRDDSESVHARQELSTLQDRGQLDHYLPCWIHLARTPAGRAVLESLLGSVPHLPALVLSQLGSEGEVFLFQALRPLLAETVQRWLSRVQSKEEEPSGVLSDEQWGPPVPLFDFLAVMDEAVPGFAAQRTEEEEEEGEGEGERERESERLELSGALPSLQRGALSFSMLTVKQCNRIQWLPR